MTEKEHDPKIIVESEAFRAINVLLATKIDGLKGLELRLEDRMQQLLTHTPAYPRPISIFVSDERRIKGAAKEDHVLRFDSQMLDHLVYLVSQIKQQQESIADLVRFKIRLLNDWDFTGGDNSEQIAVFGVPS